MDISNKMREDVVEIIYDLIEKLNEMYGWEHKLPDLSNYTTLMLLNFHHQLACQLP